MVLHRFASVFTGFCQRGCAVVATLAATQARRWSGHPRQFLGLRGGAPCCGIWRRRLGEQQRQALVELGSDFLEHHLSGG